MRTSLFAIILIAVLACPLVVWAQSMPQMKSIDPGNGKSGAEFTVSGEHLGQASVAKLYLTTGSTDIEVAITSQTETSIKFKVPEKAKPGRFALLILTAGARQVQIEQPVKVTIEE
jgi:hypothetical protein